MIVADPIAHATEEFLAKLGIYPDDQKPRRYSASRLNLYRQCGALYRYRYLEHGPDGGSAAASFGTAVHAVLETGAQRVLADPFRVPIVYQPELLDIAYEHEASHEVIEYVREHFAHMDYRHTVAAEEYFDVEIGGIRVNGYIDRVDARAYAGGPCVTVVDYKTGYKLDDYSIWKEDFQPRIYAVIGKRIFQQHFGDKIPPLVNVHFYYTSLGKTLSLSWSQELEDKLIKDLQSFDQQIVAQQFTETPGSWCGYCPRRGVCSTLQRYLQVGFTADLPSNLPLQDELKELASEFYRLKNVHKLAETCKKDISERLKSLFARYHWNKQYKVDGYSINLVSKDMGDWSGDPLAIAELFAAHNHQIDLKQLLSLNVGVMKSHLREFQRTRPEADCFELENKLGAYHQPQPISYIDVKETA